MFALLAACTNSQAATTLWEVNLKFDEFAGQAGGFEHRATNFDYVEYANKNTPTSADTTREYSVVKNIGTDPATGRSLWGPGQGASSKPISITTKVFGNVGNPWDRLRGGISNQGISSQAQVTSGTSRSGDWGLVAYQIDFPVGMDLDAQNLKLRLDNVNGSGELYEWAFVTINERNLDSPGFNIQNIGNYRNTDYANLSASTYFNPDGSVKAGGTSQPTKTLPGGKTISQFLAGQDAGPADLNVAPGWFAADKQNAIIRDGAEAFDNPGNGTGYTQNVFDVNADNLGVSGDTKINSVTVWMGYQDVAFDTNGDGFTRTGPNNQIGQLGCITFGASNFGSIIPVPEASTSLLTLLAGFFGITRRRRR